MKVWIRPGHCESGPLIAPKGNPVIRYPLFRRSLALVLLLIISSCSRQSPLTTQPDLESSALRSDAGVARSQLDREPGDFYPLAVGNQWTYEFKLLVEVLGSDGSVIERTEETLEQRYSIDCSFQAGGHQWFIQRIQHPGGTNLFRALYQDRSGLYGRERFSYRTTDPCDPGLVEGGLNVEELRYPLRRGATWVLRDEPSAPPTVVTVETHEVIETPAGRFPAARLRIKKEPASAEEGYLAWYGREGLLAIEDRTVAVTTGASGRRVRNLLSIRLKNLSVAGALASTTARPDRRR